MKGLWDIFRKNKDTQKILFAGVSGTNFVQFAPVYQQLKNDPRLEIFFSGMYQGKDRPVQLYQPFGIERRFILREKKAKNLVFDMYISPDFHTVGKKHATSVQMFHTTSFRNFSIGERARDFQHLFLIGPYMRRKFEESGMFQDQPQCFEEVGMPQTDTLLAVKATGLAQQLKLDRSLPTVLYAPVWAPIEDFLQDVQKTLTALSRLKVNLLFKMHHAFYYQQLNSIKWTEYLSSLLEKNKNMRQITDFDITPYMRISDLLVSDASAVVHQFSILNRPMVCMKIDVLRFKQDWPNLDQQAYYKRAVIEADAGEPLVEAVTQELEYPSPLGEQRLAMAKEYFYNIGCSTKVAVAKIYQLLNLRQNDEQ